MTDDGTTEVTSCGDELSHCASEPGSSQHQRLQQQHPHQIQRQVNDASLMPAGEMEMSQHERASSWLDNLPMVSGGEAATSGRDQLPSAGSASGETRSMTDRLRDTGGAQDTSHSSRSVSCDDAKYVAFIIVLHAYRSYRVLRNTAPRRNTCLGCN